MGHGQFLRVTKGQAVHTIYGSQATRKTGPPAQQNPLLVAIGTTIAQLCDSIQKGIQHAADYL
jgi:hypothetical protein